MTGGEWAPVKKAVVLPAERAGCHVAAALCRYNIDTRFRRVRQYSGKLFAVGDNAHPLVLGHVHGRELAFGNTGDNAPDGDRAVLPVDVAPVQPHDFLAAQTGVQQNGNRHTERSVKVREQAGDFVRLVDRDVLECRVRLDLDTLARIAAAQTVRNRAFHDLVNGDEDMMACALTEVRGAAHQPFNVGGHDLVERHFAEHRQDIAVEIQLVIGVGAVLDRLLLAFQPLRTPASDRLPPGLRLFTFLEKLLVGGFGKCPGASAERLLHMAAVRQVEPHAQLYAAVGLFAKTSVHNDKTPFLPEKSMVK